MTQWNKLIHSQVGFRKYIFILKYGWTYRQWKDNIVSITTYFKQGMESVFKFKMNTITVGVLFSVSELI